MTNKPIAPAHTFKVGDIFFDPCRLDDNAADFYQVINFFGRNSVLLREIAVADMGPFSVAPQAPVKNRFISLPFRCLVNTPKNRIKIVNGVYAYPYKGSLKPEPRAAR